MVDYFTNHVVSINYEESSNYYLDTVKIAPNNLLDEELKNTDIL